MTERKVKRDGTISFAGERWIKHGSGILPRTWCEVRLVAGTLMVTAGHGPVRITEEWVKTPRLG